MGIGDGLDTLQSSYIMFFFLSSTPRRDGVFFWKLQIYFHCYNLGMNCSVPSPRNHFYQLKVSAAYPFHPLFVSLAAGDDMEVCMIKIALSRLLAERRWH